MEKMKWEIFKYTRRLGRQFIFTEEFPLWEVLLSGVFLYCLRYKDLTESKVRCHGETPSINCSLSDHNCNSLDTMQNRESRMGAIAVKEQVHFCPLSDFSENMSSSVRLCDLTYLRVESWDSPIYSLDPQTTVPCVPILINSPGSNGFSTCKFLHLGVVASA